VQESEYQFFFNILGLSYDAIHASYKQLDTNNDETVSEGENTAGWVEYFTTSDPTDPFNILLGPIPGISS